MHASLPLCSHNPKEFDPKPDLCPPVVSGEPYQVSMGILSHLRTSLMLNEQLG